MTIDEMRAMLEESLPRKRYEHSIRVYETALRMIPHFHADKEKTAVGALLHDCGRQIPTKESLQKARELGIDVDDTEKEQPILLHAKLGVYYAVHKYGVTDPEVLDEEARKLFGDALPERPGEREEPEEPEEDDYDFEIPEEYDSIPEDEDLTEQEQALRQSLDMQAANVAVLIEQGTVLTED